MSSDEFRRPGISAGFCGLDPSCWGAVADSARVRIVACNTAESGPVGRSLGQLGFQNSFEIYIYIIYHIKICILHMCNCLYEIYLLFVLASITPYCYYYYCCCCCYRILYNSITIQMHALNTRYQPAWSGRLTRSQCITFHFVIASGCVRFRPRRWWCLPRWLRVDLV